MEMRELETEVEDTVARSLSAGNSRARYQPAVLEDLSGPVGGKTQRSVGAQKAGRTRDMGLGGDCARS